jgi:hypothetical protein
MTLARRIAIGVVLAVAAMFAMLADADPVASPVVVSEQSVLDYGALPDDSGDSTSAFQRAFNVCSSAGQPLAVPAGVYRITAQLSAGSNLSVTGVPGLSTLHYVLPRTGAVSLAKCVQIATGSQGVRFQGLTFRGDITDATAGTVPTFGVYADNSATGTQTANIRIIDCEFIGLTGAAFTGNNLGTVSGITVTGCRIHDIGVKAQNVPSVIHAGLGCPQAMDVRYSGNDIFNIGDGKSLDHAMYFSRSTSRVRIEGNTCRTNGIQIDGGGKVFRDFTISANTINPISDSGIILGGGLMGFAVTGNTITLGGGISGIQVYSCGLGVVSSNSINMNGQVGTGISITGASNVIVANNVIFGPSAKASLSGIYVQDNVGPISRLSITGNVISMGTTNANIAQFGVLFVSGANGSGMADNTVSGNTIVNTATGIMLHAGAKKIGRTMVAGNHLLDCGLPINVVGPAGNTNGIMQAGNMSQ